jgi:DNA/RNA endonuclease YhcR with UshA esterase domain
MIMRMLCFAVICSVLCASGALAADDVKPIGPADAVKKINEEVTLQMEVKSSALRGGVCFLNSEADHKDAKNFTIFVDKDTVAKFGAAKIEDPALYFKGKTVRVKGMVTLYHERPEIKLSGPDAIQIIEKK